MELDDPRTLEERARVAEECCEELGLTMPAVVDRLDDRVNQLYRAWPERLYVIDRSGRIAYKGGLGPFGFSPPEARAALDRLLASGG